MLKKVMHIVIETVMLLIVYFAGFAMLGTIAYVLLGLVLSWSPFAAGVLSAFIGVFGFVWIAEDVMDVLEDYFHEYVRALVYD